MWSEWLTRILLLKVNDCAKWPIFLTLTLYRRIKNSWQNGIFHSDVFPSFGRPFLSGRVLRWRPLAFPNAEGFGFRLTQFWIGVIAVVKVLDISIAPTLFTSSCTHIMNAEYLMLVLVFGIWTFPLGSETSLPSRLITDSEKNFLDHLLVSPYKPWLVNICVNFTFAMFGKPIVNFTSYSHSWSTTCMIHVCDLWMDTILFGSVREQMLSTFSFTFSFAMFGKFIVNFTSSSR